MAHHARLLLGLDFASAADVFLSEYLKSPDAQKDDYALHLYSLAAFARGKYDDAYVFSKRALLFVHGNQDLEFEIRLVQAALFDLSEVAHKDLLPKDDDEEKEEKEKKYLDRRQQILLDKRIKGDWVLYWPSSFVNAVRERADSAEAENEKSTSGFFSELLF